MIANDRQYRITHGWLRKFENSIAAHDRSKPRPDVRPRIHQAVGDALRSEADVLPSQLHAYELDRGGHVPGYIDEGDPEPATMKMPEDDTADQAVVHHELTKSEWERLESELDPAVARLIRSAYERILGGGLSADLDIFELS